MKTDSSHPDLEDAMMCRGAIEIPTTASGEFMFMPGGLQTITPFDGGIGQPIQVMVDRAGAAELEKQRSALTAKGKRPYFDFEHEDKGASYWPDSFFWKDGPAAGIYCRGEWTGDGKAGVEGKKWRMFSPVFHVDSKRAKPARLVCRDFASANMGGLVNEPAFTKISPLWAKNATGAQSGNPTDNTMNEQELTALRAKNQELETEIIQLKVEQTSIKAKKENDEFVSARIEAKEATLRANKAELESSSLKAKNAEQETAIKAHNAATAKAAVNAAIDRGAIAAKDTATIEHWTKDISERPDQAAILAKMQGSFVIGSPRLTSSVTITSEAPNGVMKEYAALVCKNSKIPLTAETAREKAELAREAAAVYAKDIAKNEVLQTMGMDQAIRAADNTDANVGLLSGALTLQRTLPNMKFQFPVLSAISTDFSAEPGLYGQTANSRIVLSLPVEDYDPTLDSNSRPKGFVNSIPGQAIDVPVTLDSYFGIPIVFGITQIAATVRDLFGEQAPMASYAIGTKLVSKLTALMTAANFNAYKGITDAAGATTSGSATIVVTDSTLNYPGQFVSGAGIPANAFVKSITDSTHIVLSAKATATASGLALTFGTGKVPTTYGTYIKALADFSGASIGDLKAAFTNNEVPFMDRFALLNPSYYAKLGQDPALNSFFAAMQSPEIITEGRLPKVQGFSPIEAPWMPSANNGVGFAGHKASLILKTRLPQDITRVSNAPIPGSVTTITDPDTGISIMLVQRVDLTGQYAEYRPELMAGAAVGERRGGLLMTSA